MRRTRTRARTRTRTGNGETFAVEAGEEAESRSEGAKTTLCGLGNRADCLRRNLISLAD